MEEIQSVIQFNHVSFQYQDDTAFTLNDVSFKIPQGKWTSIVGHNGSGKSTIAKLMVGIETAQQGDITFKSTTLTETTLNDIRKQIGIVFQNPDNQFVGSIVKYDVAFGLENNAIPKEEMEVRVHEALQQVNMLDKAEYEPSSLSGGQKQRVAIASVLALQPSVIILDEATSMLDPEARNDLLQLVKQVQCENDITIISITHDLTEAIGADHVIVMNEGQVYQEGTPHDIFNEAENLEQIGLDLPFAMKINQLLNDNTSFLTYEGLVKKL